jgi:non-canonical (house-cleaning) NTP pyrophosphatase
MLVKVGTNNPIKVEAVRLTLMEYPDLKNAEIVGANIPSQVSNQPRSWEETVNGALNRAVGAYQDGADLGVGIESGLVNAPLGWMNFSAAVVCESDAAAGVEPRKRVTALWERTWENGIHYGHSTSFPLPHNVIEKMLFEKMELDEAVHACKLVDIPNIGKVEGGFLGVLTGGRVSRTLYSKQALQMALISYENKDMFAKGFTNDTI